MNVTRIVGFLFLTTVSVLTASSLHATPVILDGCGGPASQFGRNCSLAELQSGGTISANHLLFADWNTTLANEIAEGLEMVAFADKRGDVGVLGFSHGLLAALGGATLTDTISFTATALDAQAFIISSRFGLGSLRVGGGRIEIT